MSEYDINKPCKVCLAKAGEQCVYHTDEFEEEGYYKGSPMSDFHYFGGRRIEDG